jgi:hypothetical protein
LGRTLGEIRGRLDRMKGGGPPAFVYSLPRDVHVRDHTRGSGACRRRIVPGILLSALGEDP